jgi:cobalt/nickel transport system permease protein
MHIPDGFLSPPVWVTLDLVSAPAVAILARRAQQGTDTSRIPLLGVMGAFVFAAQMINFPVGPGTSGHLVGGALLSMVVGPTAAAIVMTAILAIQAFVFQDGGIMALGANVFNMALAGVLAGYLPYRLWSRQWRSAAIFAGGFLSVLTSACLALAQLLLSGVRMPPKIIWISTALFAIGALIEGAITLAAVRAIERLNPAWIIAPAGGRSRVVGLVGLAAVGAVVAAVLFASTAPDAIEKLTRTMGGETATESIWLYRVAGGLGGLVLIYVACTVIGRYLARQRSA